MLYVIYLLGLHQVRCSFKCFREIFRFILLILALIPPLLKQSRLMHCNLSLIAFLDPLSRHTFVNKSGVSRAPFDSVDSRLKLRKNSFPSMSRAESTLMMISGSMKITTCRITFSPHRSIPGRSKVTFQRPKAFQDISFFHYTLKLSEGFSSSRMSLANFEDNTRHDKLSQ